MRDKGLLLIITIVALVFNGPIPCQATEIDWSGSIFIEEAFQDSDRSHMNIINLKMGIFAGEKENGVVLLQLQAPGRDPKTLEEVGYILDVYQAYIDLLINSSTMIRAGRQKISWGTGFNWNPTNYLGADQNRADFMVDRPGVDALDLEFNWNNALIVLVLKTQDSWYETGKALKVNWWLSGVDFSLNCYQKGDGRGLGAEFGMTVGDCVTYGEVAAKAGSRRFYIHENSEMERASDRLYLHALVGANQVLNDNLTLIVEYYYNQEGWNHREAEAFFDYLDTLTASERITALGKKGALLAELRQNYLSFTISKTDLIEDLTLSGNILWNVDDHSYQIRPALQYDLTQNSFFAVNANLNYGKSRTEFGALPYNSYINARLAFHF